MRKIIREIIKFVLILINLAGVGFLIWATTTYVPESPITPFFWLVGFIIVVYMIFSLICKINEHLAIKEIDEYYRRKYPHLPK